MHGPLLHLELLEQELEGGAVAVEAGHELGKVKRAHALAARHRCFWGVDVGIGHDGCGDGVRLAGRDSGARAVCRLDAGKGADEIDSLDDAVAVVVEELELVRGDDRLEACLGELGPLAHLLAALVAQHRGLAATQAPERKEVRDGGCQAEEHEARHLVEG